LEFESGSDQTTVRRGDGRENSRTVWTESKAKVGD